jgi:hypothetical protein
VSLLAAALGYAAKGWPVFPIKPMTKVPAGELVPHGLKDASTDPATIRRWWARLPKANVGLLTGLAFDVLDIDGDEGMAALVTEMPAEAPTIDGPTADTGKGTHCYVLATGLGNRAGVLPHLDWRGAGGYVVAPPSVHPSGAVYRWHCGAEDPDFGPSAPLHPVPHWLLDLLTRRPEPVPSPVATVGPSRDTNAYGRRALEGEVGKVLLAPVGSRNDQLNRSAFALGQLIAGGVLGVDEVISALLVAAERCGLPTTEARNSIASGLRAGSAQPRRGAAA